MGFPVSFCLFANVFMNWTWYSLADVILSKQVLLFVYNWAEDTKKHFLKMNLTVQLMLLQPTVGMIYFNRMKELIPVEIKFQKVMVHRYSYIANSAKWILMGVGKINN